MPDVAILVGVLHPVENLLYGIELVGAQHHKALVAFMQYNVLANHLAKITLVKEEIGELAQIVKRHILRICPVERELVTAIRIIGKVSCIHTVTDDK